MRRILFTLVAVSWAVASIGIARADDQADLQKLVDEAAAVVDKFRAGSQKADIDALLAKAMRSSSTRTSSKAPSCSAPKAARV